MNLHLNAALDPSHCSADVRPPAHPRFRFRAVSPLLLVLLCGCYQPPQTLTQNGPPGPFTHLGSHPLPAFRDASAYLRTVQTAAEGFSSSTPIPNGIDCADPRLGVTLRPKIATVDKCVAWTEPDNSAHVAAHFTNGWVLTASGNEVRNAGSDPHLPTLQ